MAHLELRARDGADLLGVGGAGALGHAGRRADEEGRRRRLQHKRETPVLSNVDHTRSTVCAQGSSQDVATSMKPYRPLDGC